MENENEIQIGTDGGPWARYERANDDAMLRAESVCLCRIDAGLRQNMSFVYILFFFYTPCDVVHDDAQLFAVVVVL